MGVTLGYPSGHPDPHSSIMASVVESQSTVSSIATDTSTRGLLARQPPADIETAAATNPTTVLFSAVFRCSNGRMVVPPSERK